MNKCVIVSGFLSLLITLLILPSLNFSVFADTTSQNQVLNINSTSQDTITPSLFVTKPENLSIISGWFFLTVTAIDDISIDQVVYREISSPAYEQMSQNETDPSKFRALVDSRKYSNGVNFFEIKVNDTSNNENHTILLLAIQNLEAEADINVYNVTGIAEDCPCLTDNNVSFFWKKVPAHAIPEFGGYLKLSHNFSHIFGLFVYDSSLRWISLQFDNDGDGICMENGEDIWWLQEEGTLADYTAANFRTPLPDTTQDILFEAGLIQDTGSSMEFFEIVRELETNEPSDVKFQFGIPVGIIFASDNLHQGGIRANFSLALKASPPTDTAPLNSSSILKMNGLTDLFIFGGFGLVLNVVIIVSLVIYDRKRRLPVK